MTTVHPNDPEPERPLHCLNLMSERFFTSPRRRRAHRRWMLVSALWWGSAALLLILRLMLDFSSPPLNALKLYYDLIVRLVSGIGVIGMAGFVLWCLIEFRAESGRRRMLREAAAEFEDEA